jgi:hypothetical protein
MLHGTHCAVTRTVQVRLKWVCNEGHFTFVAETVYGPYLPSHCSGVTEILKIVQSEYELQAVLIML